MREPFIGSEALAAGKLTRHQLRTRYFKLHQDIYVPNDLSITAVTLAKACWLRSHRRGILAGFSAAALHGSKWVDVGRRAAIIDTNRRPLRASRCGVTASMRMRYASSKICPSLGQRGPRLILRVAIRR